MSALALPAPPLWDSPIRWTTRHLPRTPYAVVPEKAAYAYQLFGKIVSLTLVDSHEFVMEVNLTTGEITVSRFVIELYWCAACAYVTLYQQKYQGRIAHERFIEDLRGDDTRDAMDLLSWAFEKWVNEDDPAWPDRLPRPVESPAKNSMENVADELCLVAVAVLLHHEAAHRYLRHEGNVSPNESLDRERDADAHAVAMVLDGLDETSDVFKKRAMGVAVAFGVLAAFSLHQERFGQKGMHYSAGGPGHPRRFDRLFNAMDRHISDPNHDVWGILVAILNLHFSNSKVGLPVGPADGYATFRDCVSAYVDHASAVLHWEGGEVD